jgi:hypothetical protein
MARTTKSQPDQLEHCRFLPGMLLLDIARMSASKKPDIRFVARWAVDSSKTVIDSV